MVVVAFWGRGLCFGLDLCCVCCIFAFFGGVPSITIGEFLVLGRGRMDLVLVVVSDNFFGVDLGVSDGFLGEVDPNDSHCVRGVFFGIRCDADDVDVGDVDDAINVGDVDINAGDDGDEDEAGNAVESDAEWVDLSCRFMCELDTGVLNFEN